LRKDLFSELSAKNAKIGVDGGNWWAYIPPLRRRERKFDAAIILALIHWGWLFDIVGYWKRNAGGVIASELTVFCNAHNDYDVCVSRKFLFIIKSGFGQASL